MRTFGPVEPRRLAAVLAMALPLGGCGNEAVRDSLSSHLQERTTSVYEECPVCHADIEVFWMRSAHYPHVGCVACHGESDEHMGVEDNSVLPDRALSENQPVLCLACHRQALSRREDHPRGEEAEHCTACHPPHRGEQR